MTLLHNLWTFTRDAMGNPTSIISPNGVNSGYGYDNASRLTSWNVGTIAGRAITYDDINRRIRDDITVGAIPKPTLQRTAQNTFDAADRIVFSSARYGQKLFFPQPAVFVHIKDDVASAEGFYPFKGMLFATFTDTLYYSTENNVFSNETSSLYIENHKLHFERTDSLLAFRVEKVKLKSEKGIESKYDSFKEKNETDRNSSQKTEREALK